MIRIYIKVPTAEQHKRTVCMIKPVTGLSLIEINNEGLHAASHAYIHPLFNLMVTPKTSTLDVTPPTTRWVVLVSKILLVITILFLLPELVRAKPKKRKNRRWGNVFIYNIIICIGFVRVPLWNYKLWISSRPQSLEKVYNAKVMKCETGEECGHYILEESMNCVTKCVSRKCHEEGSFDVDPLEDGEIDEVRSIVFAQCVKNEILREKYHGRVTFKR